jgi:NADPH2:quinone reductase
MKAWMATTLGGEDGLRIQNLSSPPCGPAQVRIAVRAAALNFPDVLITRGLYQLRLEPPFVPGSECAGDVVEVGSEVDMIAPGDRVLTVSGVGAFADEIVATPSVQQVHVVLGRHDVPRGGGLRNGLRHCAARLAATRRSAAR